MRTNIEIDDELMAKAMSLSGHMTKRTLLKPRCSFSLS